jgi:CysZ protein
MIIRSLTLALRQLGDARTFRLMLAVAGLTLAFFAAFGVALWLLLDHYVLPRWFAAADGWAALVAAGITVLAGWFLFRGVSMAVMGLMSDRVVESVEEDHYPAAAARAVPVSFAKGMAMGLRSARRAIGWNLLAAPFYLLLLVTGVGTLVLVLLVNMLLLGRDLEDMVLARHPGMAPLGARERHALGLVGALLFVIPVVNLLAPVVGAAMAVHMLHLRSGRA